MADAITSANSDAATGGCTAGSGGDVLELPAGSTITLTAALPVVVSEVTINANGSTIARDSAAAEFRILRADTTGASLTLNDATITGGTYATNNFGGGIQARNATGLTVNNSRITGNTAGGIQLINTVTSISNSLIEGNQGLATSQYYGGGVSINGGNVTITDGNVTQPIVADCVLAVDQVGMVRPVDGNEDSVADCDVGAVELTTSDFIFENGFE